MPTYMRNGWRRPRAIPYAKLAGAYTPDLLEAPLRGSIVPLRGATVTFTRASTATVQDFENVTRLCKSGEARFYGLRRVENLLPYPQDFTQGVWGATRASWNPSTLKLTEAVSTNNYQLLNSSQGATGVESLFWVEVKPAERTWICLQLGAQTTWFDLSAGVLGFNSANGLITAIDNGYFRCSVRGFAANSNTLIYLATANNSVQYSGDGVSGIYLRRAQLENVTGQSVKTPSEYVSNGVLSAPYHGANVDGVKYFTTKLDGSAISDLGTEQVGTLLTNNGWTAIGSGGVKVAGGATGSLYGLYSGIPNAPYQMTVVVADVAGTLTPQLGSTSLTPITAPGTYTFNVTPTAGSYWYVDGPAGTTAKVTSVSVKQRYASGYLAEPSRTQLLANPDDLSASPWVGASVTDDGTRFRGRVFWKVSKATTSAGEGRSQNIGTQAINYLAKRVALMGSANCTQADFGLYGGTSSWGNAGDTICYVESGPGTLVQLGGAGGQWRLTGLSTTVPTVCWMVRSFLVSEAVSLYIYPDTAVSTTSGKAIYAQVDNLEVGRSATSFIQNPATSGTVTRAADVLNYALTSIPANNLTFAATITKLAIPQTSTPSDSPVSIGQYNSNGYVSLGGYSKNSDLVGSDTVIGSWPLTWDVSTGVNYVFPIGQTVKAAWSFDPDGKTWRSSFNGTQGNVRVATTAKTGLWSNNNLTVGSVNNGATAMANGVNVVSYLRVYSTAYPPEVITNL